MINRLPGQESILQSSCLELFPRHFIPPCSSNWIIVLFEFLTPPSHDLEQSDHSFQSDHEQSSADIYLKSITYKSNQMEVKLMMNCTYWSRIGCYISLILGQCPHIFFHRKLHV